MSVLGMLQGIGVPVAYGYFAKPQVPPYICFIGSGQNQFEADNTYYKKQDTYQVEYYFKKKDPETEESIESTLLENGYKYSKSEDVYIESEGVFVIYYDI